MVTTTAGIGQFDRVQGRFTIDGVAGSRTDVFPSIDIANGAPTGTDATDEVVLTWADDRAGQNQEKAYLRYSTNGGRSYSPAQPVTDRSEERANQPAVAISPNGTEIYLTYNAYHQDWQSTTAAARPMNGLVRKAAVTRSTGAPTAFTTSYTGTTGDARGSSANSLGDEFLGDYNYAVASRNSGVAVFNDVRNAADCPAIDAYRQSLANGHPTAKPAPASKCLPTFGNSDIYSATVTP